MEVLFQLQFVVDCLKCLSQSEADVLSLCLGMVAREGGKSEGGGVMVKVSMHNCMNWITTARKQHGIQHKAPLIKPLLAQEGVSSLKWCPHWHEHRYGIWDSNSDLSLMVS